MLLRSTRTLIRTDTMSARSFTQQAYNSTIGYDAILIYYCVLSEGVVFSWLISSSRSGASEPNYVSGGAFFRQNMKGGDTSARSTFGCVSH